MPVSELEVPTADGVMDVYLHAPDESADARPTVIFYFDAGGVRDTMHAMAERLASSGYLVALPNLFHRSGDFPPFDMHKVFADPAERARLGEITKLAGPDAVVRDTAALLDVLAGRAGVHADRVGVVGYCLGGRMAFTVTGALPERIAAAAVIHGGGLATDTADSPHRLAPRISATLYFGVAENDPSCTPEDQARLAAALDDAHVAYRLERYRAGHGFAVPDLPTFDEAAAEQHWRRITDLFATALPAPA